MKLMSYVGNASSVSFSPLNNSLLSTTEIQLQKKKKKGKIFTSSYNLE